MVLKQKLANSLYSFRETCPRCKTSDTRTALTAADVGCVTVDEGKGDAENPRRCP